MAINVSALPAYVEQNRLPLIREAVMGAKTTRLFNLQTGIKKDAVLNILKTDIEFGNGAACGWDEAGASALSQRTIETGLIKINKAFCDKVLLGTWAEHDVRIAAGQKKLPFEEDFIAGVTDKVKEALEVALWQGDTTSLTPNLKYFDGMLKILANDPDVIPVTITAGSTRVAAVQAVLSSIPVKALKRDTIIACGYDFLMDYTQELVNLNLYHFNPGDSIEEIVIPGSFVKLVAFYGLNGQGYLVAGRLENMYYGTDLQNDEERFEFWYSKDNREFRLAIWFNAGVQVAFPDEIVLAAYTTLAGVADSALASIAASAATLAGTVNSSDQIETHNNA